MAFGLHRLWGEPDLGPISFETLKRRSSPNDALACPPDVCSARADLIPPEFAVDATALREAMSQALATEANLVRVEVDHGALIDRYVQRSALLGFPDTMNVQFFRRPGNRSTLALYSRSKLGYSDLGANKARLVRWLVKLRQHAPVVD